LRAIAGWVFALPTAAGDPAVSDGAASSATVPDGNAGDTAAHDADIGLRCERIRLGLEGFADLLDALSTGRRPARPPMATPELVRQCWHDINRSRADTAAATVRQGHRGPQDHRAPQDHRDMGGELITAATDRLEESLARASGAALIVTAHGPGRMSDLIRTHIVWAVVQADDLSRSLPQRDRVPTPRKPTSIACRTLTELLAQAHPGKSVEVRVPPYAAVQCGTGAEGPTHTRGTPPNVVEAKPLIFLRLATGRLSWPVARAEGMVSASGQRADLSDLLPVLS
jgi:hypothetical protein